MKRVAREFLRELSEFRESFSECFEESRSFCGESCVVDRVPGSCVVDQVAEESRGWGGEGPNPERHGPATRARAGTSPVPHAGGTRGAVALRDDAPQGSRDSYFFSLGLCK